MGHARVREVAPHAPTESEQIALALSQCALYGAPPHLNLWRAIDYVVTERNLLIIELEERQGLVAPLPPQVLARTP